MVFVAGDNCDLPGGGCVVSPSQATQMIPLGPLNRAAFMSSFPLVDLSKPALVQTREKVLKNISNQEAK